MCGGTTKVWRDNRYNGVGMVVAVGGGVVTSRQMEFLTSLCAPALPYPCAPTLLPSITLELPGTPKRTRGITYAMCGGTTGIIVSEWCWLWQEDPSLEPPGTDDTDTYE
jgi:hypothetical protein